MKLSKKRKETLLTTLILSTLLAAGNASAGFLDGYNEPPPEKIKPAPKPATPKVAPKSEAPVFENRKYKHMVVVPELSKTVTSNGKEVTNLRVVYEELKKKADDAFMKGYLMTPENQSVYHYSLLMDRWGFDREAEQQRQRAAGRYAHWLKMTLINARHEGDLKKAREYVPKIELLASPRMRTTMVKSARYSIAKKQESFSFVPDQAYNGENPTRTVGIEHRSDTIKKSMPSQKQVLEDAKKPVPTTANHFSHSNDNYGVSQHKMAPSEERKDKAETEVDKLKKNLGDFWSDISTGNVEVDTSGSKDVLDF